LGVPSSTNDNCAVASVTNDAPGSYGVGTNAVVWTVTDIHGNSATCTQRVIVVDNEAPTISCPADVTVNTDAGLCSASGVNLGVPSSTNDNCGVASVTNDAPGSYGVGTNAVIWTVTDIHGNSATCTQRVIVVDNQPPTISCPANVSVNADTNQCFASGVSLGAPVTGDNCGVASVTNNATATFGVGTNAVTWTVTDVHGNSAACTQRVVVVDNQAPTISCPANVLVNADTNQCFASGVSLGVTVTGDNCGVASITNNATATFAVGTNTVVWMVTDVHGHTAACTQQVVVVDNQPPTITCPSDVTVTNPVGESCASDVALGTPVTGDNCGVASFTNNAPSSFPPGTNEVVWTVTDVHGNSTNCSQLVIVVETPVDANSFRMLNIQKIGNDIKLIWLTIGNSTNVIQVVAPTVSGSYTNNYSNLSTVFVPGSGAVTTNYMDSGGATNVPSRFYRIRLQPGVPPCLP
jgi:hypothetical protein